MTLFEPGVFFEEKNLSFLSFQDYKIILRAFLRWFFFFALIPSGHLHPFCQHHFSFTLTSSNSLSSSGWTLRVSPMAVAPAFPQSAITSITLFTFNSDFTPTIIFSFFLFCLFVCCTFILVGNFPLLIINFCKMPCGFITGRWGKRNYTLFCLCMNRRTGIQWSICDRLWKKWWNWSLIMIVLVDFWWNL